MAGPNRYCMRDDAGTLGDALSSSSCDLVPEIASGHKGRTPPSQRLWSVPTHDAGVGMCGVNASPTPLQCPVRHGRYRLTPSGLMQAFPPQLESM